jgi:hypothetical protein
MAIEEADPLTVGRPERGVGVLGAGDLSRWFASRNEPPNPQPFDAVVTNRHVREAAAVWRECEWHIEAGGVRRSPLGPQLEAEIGRR